MPYSSLCGWSTRYMNIQLRSTQLIALGAVLGATLTLGTSVMATREKSAASLPL